MLTGKLTKRHGICFTIARREQKGLLEMFDEDRYNELTDILDKLYPLAYTTKQQPIHDDDTVTRDHKAEYQRLSPEAKAKKSACNNLPEVNEKENTIFDENLNKNVTNSIDDKQ